MFLLSGILNVFFLIICSSVKLLAGWIGSNCSSLPSIDSKGLSLNGLFFPHIML